MTDKELIAGLNAQAAYNNWLYTSIGGGKDAKYERAAADRLEELTEQSEWTEGQNMPQYPKIPYKFGEHYCLKCGEKAPYDKLEREEILTNYCPFCGKEMINNQ